MVVSLEEKRQSAPPELVKAVDVVSTCIDNASRRVTDARLACIIEQALMEEFGDPPAELHWKVRMEAVDVFYDVDNPDHAHAAVRQDNATTLYWRNRGEPHGEQNYFR